MLRSTLPIRFFTTLKKTILFSQFHKIPCPVKKMLNNLGKWKSIHNDDQVTAIFSCCVCDS